MYILRAAAYQLPVYSVCVNKPTAKMKHAAEACVRSAYMGVHCSDAT